MNIKRSILISISALLMVLVPVPNASAQNCNQANFYSQWTYLKPYTFEAGSGYCIQGLNTRMVWQDDGNLVVYSGKTTGGSALWATNTSGRGKYLIFDKFGRMGVYDRLYNMLWRTPMSSNISNKQWFVWPYNNKLVLEEQTLQYTQKKTLWVQYF